MGNNSSKNQMQFRSGPLGSVESMDASENVQSLSYFYSDLSRKQAQDVMGSHAENPGSFLIRFGSKPRRYAITLVVAKNTVGHVVVFSPNDRCFYAETESQFETMSDLVKYYQSNPVPNWNKDKEKTKLKIPIHRFRPPIPYPYQKPTDIMIYDTEIASSPDDYESVNEGIATWRERHQLDQPRRFTVFPETDGRLVRLRYPTPMPPPNNMPCRFTDHTIPKQLRTNYPAGPKTKVDDDGFASSSSATFQNDNTVPKQIIESDFHSATLNNRRNFKLPHGNNIYLTPQPLKNNNELKDSFHTCPKRCYEVATYEGALQGDVSSDLYISMDPVPQQKICNR